MKKFFRLTQVIRVFHLVCAFTLLPLFSVNAQKTYLEMMAEDITDAPDIRSSVNAKKDTCLLIVKTTIPNLRFKSNFDIFSREELDVGKWKILLPHGTHIISFQAKDYISVQKRIYFRKKEVKGFLVKPMDTSNSIDAQNTGIVSLISTPLGAEVFLNDEFYGTTPFVGRLLPGIYSYEIRKDLHFPTRGKFSVVIDTLIQLENRLKANFGKLRISSNPPGAMVHLDGDPIGETPLESTVLEPGIHELKVTKPYHRQDLRRVFVDADTTTDINVNLQATFGEISIQSIPSDAVVIVDGKEVGKTPVYRQKIIPGVRTITLRKNLYIDKTIMVDIEEHENYTDILKLKPDFGTVTIDAPLAAKIIIDNDTVGTGSLSYKLKSGLHLIRAEIPRYNPFVDTINVSLGEELPIKAVLKPRKGNLVIAVSPVKGPPASVYINSKLVGSDNVVTLAPFEGKYELVVKKPGYIPQRKSITVKYNQKNNVQIEMISTSQSIEVNRGKWVVRRNITLGGTALFAASGYALRKYSDDKYDKYLSTTDPAEAQDLEKDVKELDDLSLIAYAITGLFGAFTVYNQIQLLRQKSHSKNWDLGYHLHRGEVVLKIKF